MVCRDCAYMKEVEDAPGLYRCGNTKSDRWNEWTGLCCEDECPDGEREVESE